MTWRGKTGAFEETYRSNMGVTFEWKIPDILSMPATTSDYYTSPSLKFSGSIWYLCIYPKGKPWSSRWITIVIMRTNEENPVRVSVGLKKDDGSEEEITRQKVFPEHEKSFVVTEFLHSSDLMDRKSQLAPGDALTVTCALWRDAPTSTLGISAMRKHFGDLLCSADDHDVTIQVGDREFSAHKCILRARSTVFEAMFRHKMKESADNSITIEDCDPDTFGEFLRYVYAGQVEDLSVGNAMALYYTADKYDVACLKEICVHFLKASLSVSVICDILALATKHGEHELLGLATNFFTENTKEILATPEWRCFLKTNPDEANELFIQSFERVEGKE